MTINEKGAAEDDPARNFNDYLSAGRIVKIVRRIANELGYNGDPFANTKFKHATISDLDAILVIEGKLPGHIKRQARTYVRKIIQNIVLSSTEDSCDE